MPDNRTAPIRRLAAVTAALALIAIGLALLFGWAGERAASPSSLVAYPSAGQVSDFSFMTREYASRAARGEHPKLVLGSSELAPKLAGPTHPAALFANGRFGIDAFIAGRASANDLWQAIEVGAFADKLDDKRAVLFVSMQWFMCYRKPERDVPGLFSEGAYRAFMENGDISDGVKRRVADRLAEYGVTRDDIPVLADAVRAVDGAVGGFVHEARRALQGVKDAAHEPGAQAVPMEPVPEGDALAPDWDALFAEAAADAEERSSGNPYGFYDDWYEKKFERWLDGAKRRWRVTGDAYFSEQELEDFKLALEVCREAGVTPLVVIQPVKGAAYDQTIYTAEVRQRYYDMVRAACREARVDVADFSDREYDRFFLRDYSHPSALGGAYYSRAIYDWFQGEQG